MKFSVKEANRTWGHKINTEKIKIGAMYINHYSAMCTR